MSICHIILNIYVFELKFVFVRLKRSFARLLIRLHIYVYALLLDSTYILLKLPVFFPARFSGKADLSSRPGKKRVVHLLSLSQLIHRTCMKEMNRLVGNGACTSEDRQTCVVKNTQVL